MSKSTVPVGMVPTVNINSQTFHDVEYHTLNGMLLGAKLAGHHPISSVACLNGSQLSVPEWDGMPPNSVLLELPVTDDIAAIPEHPLVTVALTLYHRVIIATVFRNRERVSVLVIGFNEAQTYEGIVQYLNAAEVYLPEVIYYQDGEKRLYLTPPPDLYMSYHLNFHEFVAPTTVTIKSCTLTMQLHSPGIYGFTYGDLLLQIKDYFGRLPSKLVYVPSDAAYTWFE
jgi:hypothetical protein